MLAVLEYDQPQNYSALLSPLLQGLPVTLIVSDPKVKVIKKRIGKPILFITPTSFYGLDKKALVFALQGHGCEVMEITKLKAAYLNRMGLSYKAASILIRELNLVFNQGEKTND